MTTRAEKQAERLKAIQLLKKLKLVLRNNVSLEDLKYLLTLYKVGKLTTMYAGGNLSRVLKTTQDKLVVSTSEGYSVTILVYKGKVLSYIEI